MEMKEWIQETFTPAVMVISSPEVEALCQESNGFNIVDMLRPFGYLQQLSGDLPASHCHAASSLAHNHRPLKPEEQVFGGDWLCRSLN